MTTRTQDKTVSLHHDSTRSSVQNSRHVDLDDTSVPNPALMLYVEIKLNAVAPWLVHSTSYQSAFQEAYQLCQSGYDFNLIVYEQPTGHYITCYEPMPISKTNHYKRRRKKKGLRRCWGRLFRSSRRQVQPKYHGEIMMMPGKSKWVEEDTGRLIVVPEGILRCNATGFAL
ncbi:MAG: hypothetical protein ETSY2_46730 [Candidatus Entotheonella gemina]|uniref:Uncharacterized protein n=1 Tax=Candidatus Entotheonella gemina TaxID=1429439 RepID=W4LFZ1_9BACT|nr:MAG: hypothetical protein ETSY2_46730 [Candidatus Entotheonella gemina]